MNAGELAGRELPECGFPPVTAGIDVCVDATVRGRAR